MAVGGEILKSFMLIFSVPVTVIVFPVLMLPSNGMVTGRLFPAMNRLPVAVPLKVFPLVVNPDTLLRSKRMDSCLSDFSAFHDFLSMMLLSLFSFSVGMEKSTLTMSLMLFSLMLS